MAGDPRFESERNWALDQLEDNGTYNRTEHDLIMGLLEVWWGADVAPCSGDVWRALDAFESLARGKAIPTPEQEDIRFQWVPVKPGQIKVRDYVRVKLDAYPGSAGIAHNGRSGPVVAIRSGDIQVRYEDRETTPPSGLPARHSPHVLEKRVPAS